MDFLDNAVPLVQGIIREQLAELVIQSLDGVRVNRGRLFKFQLDDGKNSSLITLSSVDSLLGALESFFTSSRNFLQSLVAASSGGRSFWSSKTRR